MEVMKINEHLVKISAGTVTTLQPLELGSDVLLRVEGTVTKIEDKDNQDGTFNRIYVVKGIIVEED